MTVPTLAQALDRRVSEDLAEADDRFIRVDVPSHYPIQPAVDSLLAAGDIRIGVLDPFDAGSVTGALVTDKADELTEWRNAEDGIPTVIFGAALGPEEAGLNELTTVSESDVLDD